MTARQVLSVFNAIISTIPPDTLEVLERLDAEDEAMVEEATQPGTAPEKGKGT